MSPYASCFRTLFRSTSKSPMSGKVYSVARRWASRALSG